MSKQQEQRFDFKLTQQEADIIVKALGEQPYKLTAGAIQTMQMQYNEQSKTKPEPATKQPSTGNKNKNKK